MFREYLKERSMESLVYLLFLQEKTQKEAIECLYNKKYSNINVSDFKQAREKLLDDNVLESSGSLRNASFKSKIKPFIEYVKKRGKDEKNRKESWFSEITKEEEKALKTMLDSNWFFSFLSLKMLSKAPGLARKDNGRLVFQYKVDGAMWTLGTFLDDLMAFSSACFSDVSPIQFTELNNYPDFESYIEDQRGWIWKDQISPEKFLELQEEEINAGITYSDWAFHFMKKIFLKDKIAYKLPSYHLKDGELIVLRKNSTFWLHIPTLETKEEFENTR